LVHEYLANVRALDVERVQAALLADYTASGARGRPQCLAQRLSAQQAALPKTPKHLAQRQARHQSSKKDALKLEA
jgi:hypothetical protein